ncbi:MAG: biotin--[acetyl-CoA-carboxylase] ligase [Rikenellaceae bacterium]|nr:biotin--[acetyl-CoA-carboxylase] ligase [Rikenellaceae bacterium]
MIYHFDILSSTNDEAFDPRYGEGDVVWAGQQTAGRGQRGHKWLGGEGENLMFTAIFEPRFLPPVRQFLFSEAVALAIVDAMREWGIEAKIKWTNDIYVGDSKLAGILIEHRLVRGELARSIAGIGLNVNQTVFDDSLPNPVSMAQISGRQFDCREVLDSVAEKLQQRYMQLRQGEAGALQEEYHNTLYRLDEQHWFALPDGNSFRGTIRGVEASGALLVEKEEGTVGSYMFKEIEFVLKNR